MGDASAQTSTLSQLMAAYQAGDVMAFDSLYSQLSGPVHGYLRSLTRDGARADDLLQETFFHVHRARHTYDPSRSAKAWISAIAHNVFLMWRRGAGRLERHEGLAGDDLPDVPIPAAAESLGTQELVRGVLALLGLRDDTELLGPILTWGPASLQAAAGVVLVALALAAAVPGRGVGTGLSVLAIAAALGALVAQAILSRRASVGMGIPHPWTHHGPACFGLTALFGLSALVLVAALVRHAAPLRVRLTAVLSGAGCGVMAEGIYRLHCGITDLGHVLIWHLGAVVVLVLAGLAAGLAWERREAARMAARLEA